MQQIFLVQPLVEHLTRGREPTTLARCLSVCLVIAICQLNLTTSSSTISRPSTHTHTHTHANLGLFTIATAKTLLSFLLYIFSLYFSTMYSIQPIQTLCYYAMCARYKLYLFLYMKSNHTHTHNTATITYILLPSLKVHF